MIGRETDSQPNSSSQAAILENGDWYAEVRENAPWWIGWSMNGGQLRRLWRFAVPVGNANDWTPLREAAFIALRNNTPLPRYVTDWRDDLKDRMKVQIDAFEWDSLQPGSTGIPDRVLLDMGRQSAITGAPRQGRGAQSTYTDDDIIGLHRQATWLAAKVYEFQDSVGEYRRSFALSKSNAWEVRFPMLEQSLCNVVFKRPVRASNFNARAIELVSRRGGLSGERVRKRLRR